MPGGARAQYIDRYTYIHTYIYTYNHSFIFGIFIFGRGGYNNAQPAKSYFGLFNLATALSGNGQSAKSKFFNTSTSLIPKFKVQNLSATAAQFLICHLEFRILIFSSYHSIFDTKIKKIRLLSLREFRRPYFKKTWGFGLTRLC